MAPRIDDVYAKFDAAKGKEAKIEFYYSLGDADKLLIWERYPTCHEMLRTAEAERKEDGAL